MASNEVVSRDAFYTPEILASEMIARLPHNLQGTIADFTVGSGALLNAAERRFGNTAQYVGTDINRKTVRTLSLTHPEWSVGTLDIFSARSRNASLLWRESIGNLSALLLNPPFSYRGAGGVQVAIESMPAVRVTPALAALAISMETLKPRGIAVAVLPLGTLQAQKNRILVDWLTTRYTFRVVKELARYAFPGVAARTTIVEVVPLAGREPLVGAEQGAENNGNLGCVRVVRGGTPRHLLTSTQPGPLCRFVHTTDIKNGSVILDSAMAPRKRGLRGPFLLLPRIGRPDPRKIAVWSRKQTLVLSDCLFALIPEGGISLPELQSVCKNNFEDLVASYAGSCAPYLTIRSLTKYLRRLGLCVHDSENGMCRRIVDVAN